MASKCGSRLYKGARGVGNLNQRMLILLLPSSTWRTCLTTAGSRSSSNLFANKGNTSLSWQTAVHDLMVAKGTSYKTAGRKTHAQPGELQPQHTATTFRFGCSCCQVGVCMLWSSRTNLKQYTKSKAIPWPAWPRRSVGLGWAALGVHLCKTQ